MRTDGNNLIGAQWRKSTRSNGNGGDCIEIALDGEHRAVRDSKDPTGPALMFTAAVWATFNAAVRSGEFD